MNSCSGHISQPRYRNEVSVDSTFLATSSVLSVLPSTCSIATVNLLSSMRMPTGCSRWLFSLPQVIYSTISSISFFLLTLIHFAGTEAPYTTQVAIMLAEQNTLPTCGAPLFEGMHIINNTSNIIQLIHLK